MHIQITNLSLYNVVQRHIAKCPKHPDVSNYYLSPCEHINREVPRDKVACS